MEFKKNLAEALLKFQGAIKSVNPEDNVDFTMKDGRKVKFDYANLATVLDYALPILTECGLLFETQNIIREIKSESTTKTAEGSETTESRITGRENGIRAWVWHVPSGEGKSDEVFHSVVPTDIKDRGAQITYLRRYACMSLLGLSVKGEKEDEMLTGSGPSEGAGEGQKPPQKPTQQLGGKKPAPNTAADKAAQAAKVAEIEKYFTEEKLSEHVELLQSVNINNKTEAVEFRKKFPSTQAMVDAINNKEGA